MLTNMLPSCLAQPSIQLRFIENPNNIIRRTLNIVVFEKKIMCYPRQSLSMGRNITRHHRQSACLRLKQNIWKPFSL